MAKNKLARLIVCCVLFAVPVLSRAQTDCSQYDHTVGPINYASSNSQQHSTGNHGFAHLARGSCSYAGSASSVAVGCGLTAQAFSTSSVGDSGSLNIPLYSHSTNYSDAQGGASGVNGAAASADSMGAGAVRSCLGSCSTNISITGSGNGGGFGVSFSPTPLWEDKYHYVLNCPGETLPAGCIPTAAPPYPGSGGGSWVWDYGTCSWVWQSCTQETCPGGGGSSPVVIDTLNTGFVFTDPIKGNYVTFDLRGDGNYGHYSWPQHGSGNAWLVYDRDGDGIIKNGQELFGNFTPHSDGGVTNHPDPNGFLALAWYDMPSQGGNLDAIIDKNDAIWTHLKLWIDEHCYLTPNDPCQSLPTELYDLDAKGIHSLSLVYGVSPKTDDVGNKFTFYAVVNPEIHDAPLNQNGEHADSNGSPCCDLHQKSKDGRLMYDVFLRSAP